MFLSKDTVNLQADMAHQSSNVFWKQQPLPNINAIENDDDKNIERVNCMVQISDPDRREMMPPPEKKTRNHSASRTMATAKLKVGSHKRDRYRCRVGDPKGLLLLSFPLKLHLILESYEFARDRRKVNKRLKSIGGNWNTKHNDTHETATCRFCYKNNGASVKKDEIIIGWLPRGNAFKIYDKGRFVSEIMPHYFLGHGKNAFSFETFLRCLDLWGFSHVMCVEGPTTRTVHICSHPNFIKGNPQACNRLRLHSQHEHAPP
ncbi:unnamed protein product [Pseudo-nitzschia multistriata]|uniref:HSF-type DNA-binding domain-containing protein n=1 Tax=Pseudo-nitzschia multistriata TaxID=183589 RepID=A0A448YY32_9STRA|nr:unnamed protein product [Pseudo-nitzschia multistriata]